MPLSLSFYWALPSWRWPVVAVDGRTPKDSGPASVEIAETDEGFQPKAITVGKAQEITLTFDNKGKDIHNLRIAGATGFMSSSDAVLGNPVVQPGRPRLRGVRRPRPAR